MAAVKKAAKKAGKKAGKRAGSKVGAKPKGPAKKAASARVRGLPKAEGTDAVRAYFAKVPAEHRAIGVKVDDIIAKHVPEARRAIKWSSPFWGIEGRGWFASFASFKSYAKVNFFAGTKLKPVPPEGGSEFARSINIPSMAELDEKQMTAWIKQAAALPGWGK